MTSVPEPTVAITVSERLVRLETKLDLFIERIDRERSRLDELESRTRRVERWTYALPPTVVIALGAAVAQITK